MNDVTVSICIPVYNGGKYIAETLQSLIAQTYSNIEIIVSDNASTDNTGDIVRSFCAQDARIKYYRNDSNIGYCSNIQKVVNTALSDTIAIYHADDIYEPQIIEQEFSVLKNHPEIDGVFSVLREFCDGEET